MTLIFRLTALIVAGLAGITATAAILWPGWIDALHDGGPYLPWNAGQWQLLAVNQAGYASSASLQPVLLPAIALLFAAALAITLHAIFTAESKVAAAQPAAAVTIDPGAEVSSEIAKVAVTLRAHLEVSGLYGTVLAKANAQLPSAGKPEQLRIIVSYLMVENENMRSKASNLQSSLEQSRKQIDNLRSNLAAAKAEGMSDGLTALKNRRSFDLALAAAVAEAHKTDLPICLVMADIDHFKSVNDRLGHMAGDDVLKWFARVLGAKMKGRDTVARYGGEEFAIILPQTRIANAANLAGQIRSQLEQTTWRMTGAPQTTLKLTASFGVAELLPGEGTDGLISRADAKLYEAKTSGRNRVSA